ncbi:MAG TPA: 6,7-dimethyl-8-ribityllumazine synthase, partial [Chthonomonadaceae bacterium]|nr:6,7-dimethyl-8-ribityllumazine synthase [Chthonomonadaceae bacterium]
MPEKVEGQMTAAGLQFGIVVSRWNEFITKALLEGALETLRRYGADMAEVRVVHVPGSFEIPVALQAMAQ